MKSEVRDYRTGGDEVVLDITDDCAGFVDGEGDGLLQLFVPHATLGIAVIETGSGSVAIWMAAPFAVEPQATSMHLLFWVRSEPPEKVHFCAAVPLSDHTPLWTS